jgi:hypothetical protein
MTRLYVDELAGGIGGRFRRMREESVFVST